MNIIRFPDPMPSIPFLLNLLPSHLRNVASTHIFFKALSAPGGNSFNSSTGTGPKSRYVLVVLVEAAANTPTYIEVEANRITVIMA
jgi:hypothetical protein